MSPPFTRGQACSPRWARGPGERKVCDLLVALISGGPWPATLGSGAWVPSQRLRLGHCGESTRSQPPSPVVSDKGVGPLALQKEFPQRQKAVKQVFIKRKKNMYSTCG